MNALNFCACAKGEELKRAQIAQEIALGSHQCFDLHSKKTHKDIEHKQVPPSTAMRTLLLAGCDQQPAESRHYNNCKLSVS